MLILLVGCQDHTLEGTHFTASVCFASEPCGMVNGVQVGCVSGTCVEPSIGLCEVRTTCSESEVNSRYRAGPVNELTAPCHTSDKACGIGDLCSDDGQHCYTSRSGCNDEFLIDEVCDVDSLEDPSDPQ